MTDDFKSELLDYITGDLEIEQGTDEPIIVEDNGSIDSSHIGFIHSMLRAEGFSQGGEVMTGTFTELGKIQFTNTDKILIYGNMSGRGITEVRGSIIIADENYNYISYIAEFSTGTKFNRFEVLERDETNLVYGVDYNSDTQTKRFLLLNDIIGSYLTYREYKCVLRKSYNFPSNYNLQYLTIYGTYKKISSAEYLFIGSQYDPNSTPMQPIYNPVVITVDVNVGEQNEWNRYTSNVTAEMDMAFDSFCIWQDNNLQLKFGAYAFMQGMYNEFTFDGSTITNTKSIGWGSPKSINMVDINTTYLVSETVSPATIEYDKVGTNSLINIKTETLTGNIQTIQSYKINGLLFVLLGTYNQNTETRMQEVNLIVNDEFYSNPIENVILYINDNLQHDFMVFNQFNLYKMMYSGMYQEVTINPRSIIGSSSLDYNPNNYNGESYSNYNSLIAHKGTLYNNGNLIFSRNLYNKTILNNTTTSTMQIPSSMLNDTNIEQENLVSETNLEMVNNQSTITKNIYEMLLINFINTINVIDEDTTKNYPTTANYVNTNINTGTQTNYENTQCSKYRINYADNTTSVGSLTWTSIDKFNKETTISISVSKLITSIDLISENETTVYMSIDGSDLVVGNNYTINQKIRTSNKPLPVQLQYNNEDVMYNNENVMVYVKE